MDLRDLSGGGILKRIGDSFTGEPPEEKDLQGKYSQEYQHYQGYDPADFDTSRLDHMVNDSYEYVQEAESALQAFDGFVKKQFRDYQTHTRNLYNQYNKPAALLQGQSISGAQTGIDLENQLQGGIAASAQSGGGLAGAQRFNQGSLGAIQSGAQAAAKEDMMRDQAYIGSLQNQHRAVARSIGQQANLSTGATKVGLDALGSTQDALVGLAGQHANIGLQRQQLLQDDARIARDDRYRRWVAEEEIRRHQHSRARGQRGAILNALLAVAGEYTGGLGKKPKTPAEKKAAREKERKLNQELDMEIQSVPAEDR